MAISAPARRSISASRAIPAGTRWRATGRRHHGWLVEVVTPTATSVVILCLAGPGHAKGRRYRLGLATFLAGYVPY